MERANASGLFEVEDNNILFIFDLNSITSRQYLDHEPLCLAVFTELVNTFKDIGVDGYMFKYVADENIIISDSKALTIDYINSLKEKVKAEYRPLNIEEVYTFTCPIRHIDIVNSEAVFLDKYNVTSDLLCSTTVDYKGKTISIKSKCNTVKRTIPYFVANLIESCIYVPNYIDKMQFNNSTKPIKYPYRELIKDLYTTDFIKRSVAIKDREDENLVLHDKSLLDTNIAFEEPLYRNSFTILSPNHIASNSINKEFNKVEFDGYVESIDTITDDQINEFFEDPELFNEALVTTKVLEVNPTNYDQTKSAHKVAEALINESNAVNNIFNISDYAPPFTSNLYVNRSSIKDEVEEFFTPIPENVEELLDESKAYEALAEIRKAKAESRQEA